MTTGIILAAGQSRRFGLENGFGKCFTRVGDKLLVEYPMRTLISLGIEKIVIGINPRDESMARAVSSKYDNVKIKFSSSRGTAGCLRDVLVPEINKGIVLYGDSVYSAPITRFYDVFQNINSGWAVIGVKQTTDLRNFMAIVKRDDEYIPLLKPHGLEMGLAYVGLFGFNDHLILNKLSELNFSPRGELELTDLIKKYAALKMLELGFYFSGLVDCNTRERIAKVLNEQIR